MDAIMDLTARAVSFITLIQDSFLRASATYNNKNQTPHLQDVYGEGFKEKFSKNLREVREAYKKRRVSDSKVDPDSSLRPIGFEIKLMSLVWLSARSADDEDKENAERYIIELCTSLVQWINVNNKEIEKFQVKNQIKL